MNSKYYYDAPQDDEELLAVNCIDMDREFSGDPFDIVAKNEEESGWTLALS